MTRYRWFFLALIFLATSLNYLDRIVFAILMPAIRVDIPITPQEYGIITGAFQVAYGVGNFLFGQGIDRVGARAGYALALAWWSLAACAHALSRNTWQLGMWRGVLGLGEAGNFPAAAKSIAEWFPKRDRAFAMGICVASTNVAAMVGPPLFVAINLAYGWRASFIATGLAGLVVSLLWAVFYRQPAEHRGANAAELAYVRSDADAGVPGPALTWREAVKQRPAWGFAIAKAFTDPVWWFYLNWLPLYFTDVRHLNLTQIAWALPVIYLMADVGSLAGGWLPGRLMARGWSAERARKFTMALCVMWMPISAFAVAAPGLPLTVLLISLGTMGHQGWSANLFTTVSDAYPASAVGTVVGLGQCLASFAGLLVSSLLPGFLIPLVGYTPVFVLMGCLHLGGLAAVHLLMTPRNPNYSVE